MHTISLLFHDVYAADPRESGFASAAADRYKLSAPAFDAQLKGLVGDLSNSFVMTVDDGGVSYHRIVADRLEARGWRGHCFVTTDVIGSRGFLDAAQIRDLDARGHVIGSHSASHPGRFSACGVDRMRQEWSRSRKVLEDLLGHEVLVASLPGGYYSRTVAHAARAAGLQVLFTSEPTTVIRDEQGCTVIGRFAVRRDDGPDTARRLVMSPPWARRRAWVSWNAKGLIKPLLGQAYVGVAGLIHGGAAATPPPHGGAPDA